MKISNKLYHMMKGLVLALLLSTTSVYACGIGEVTAEGYENAPLSHAYNHWKQGEKSPIPFVFVDVRTPEEYKLAHIPGAINIPVTEINARMNEIPQGKEVYVYCHSGKRAARAATILAKAGFPVENILQSMVGWQAAGYPTTK
ncbi:MAG: rhodanese-like domain-containing protein [Ghiorsea sp.]